MMVRMHDPGDTREERSPTPTATAGADAGTGDSFEEFYAATFQPLLLRSTARSPASGRPPSSGATPERKAETAKAGPTRSRTAPRTTTQRTGISCWHPDQRSKPLGDRTFRSPGVLSRSPGHRTGSPVNRGRSAGTSSGDEHAPRLGAERQRRARPVLAVSHQHHPGQIVRHLDTVAFIGRPGRLPPSRLGTHHGVTFSLLIISIEARSFRASPSKCSHLRCTKRIHSG